MIKSQAANLKQAQMTEARMTQLARHHGLDHLRIRSLNLFVIWSLVLGHCVLAGCSRAPKTVQLSGKVIFRGQPVPAGYITFTPDVGNGNRGSIKLIKIKDGVYDSSQVPPDQALTPGAYQLRFAGFDGKVQPRFNQGKQIFNPVQDSFVVPDSVSTKDFTIPDSAGQNVLISPTDDN
jgi:hypothetical protein